VFYLVVCTTLQLEVVVASMVVLVLQQVELAEVALEA
jgi:hypothetical protein